MVAPLPPPVSVNEYSSVPSVASVAVVAMRVILVLEAGVAVAIDTGVGAVASILMVKLLTLLKLPELSLAHRWKYHVPSALAVDVYVSSSESAVPLATR